MLGIDNDGKLGVMVTPGVSGGAGDNNPQTITSTPQMLGPLPGGNGFKYSVVGDADMYVLQGSLSSDATQFTPVGGTAIAVSSINQAKMTQLGVLVPAKTEVVVPVGNSDGYLFWCKVGSVSDGSDFRCNRRS